MSAMPPFLVVEYSTVPHGRSGQSTSYLSVSSVRVQTSQPIRTDACPTLIMTVTATGRPDTRKLLELLLQNEPTNQFISATATLQQSHLRLVVAVANSESQACTRCSNARRMLPTLLDDPAQSGVPRVNRTLRLTRSTCTQSA